MPQTFTYLREKENLKEEMKNFPRKEIQIPKCRRLLSRRFANEITIATREGN